MKDRNQMKATHQKFNAVQSTFHQMKGGQNMATQLEQRRRKVFDALHKRYIGTDTVVEFNGSSVKITNGNETQEYWMGITTVQMFEKVFGLNSEFTSEWIKKTGIPIAESYHGNITLRALHYQLVARGMVNDINHYKKVVNAMIDARWAGEISFDAFLDHERETIGTTGFKATDVESTADQAKIQIKAWATSYSKNRWENQPIYPEVFIEKKALQGVFERPCRRWDVALNPCKGYPSLTFLHDACNRFKEAESNGKTPVILYFGDYDPSGEDIPRSIHDNLLKMGVDVEVKRIALMEDQVRKWKLPPAPTKITDTRSRNWDDIGQVELDAVEPNQITKLCEGAIKDIFDSDLYDELMEQEKEEKEEFREILKRDFESLLD